MDIPFNYLLAGGLSIGYLVVLGIALRNRLQLAELQPWLLGTLFAALLAQAIHLIHPNAHEGPYASLFVGGITQPAIATVLSSLLLVAFAGLSQRFLQRRGAMLIFLLGVIWLAGLLAAYYQGPVPRPLGQAGWVNRVFTGTPDTAGAIALGGWAILGIFGLLASFYSFYRAHLPEIGNRALFWVIVIPLVWMGAALGTSGSGALKEIGWAAQFIGMMGAVYGAIAHRVFDIRRVLRLAITSTMATVVTAVVVLAALVAAETIAPGTPENFFLLLLGLAVAAAITIAPLRAFTLGLINQLFGGVAADAATILRRYSQDVSGVVELNELADVVTSTLRKTLRVRRGGLLLATRDENDTIRLETMPSSVADLADLPDVRGWIPKGSPVYEALLNQHTPLLQYDLEYSRQYADAAPDVKTFFKQLHMGAYGPIVVQGQLIGLLAAGAKNNDNPFYPQDLELLATVANQTGVALRNARLVNDLRNAGDDMQKLNQDLLDTKVRLEQLDSVKTDFITIASHELRTPLAQIRGYTDILDALNEQGMLDPDQMTGMTNNLRKATDRLERLIADMLDVSQLGLDAMDLRFAQTTIDNVMRLAIEPLAESIKQRKLQLAARGLKGLPPIEADMQRLVQAFRNIVLNSIKYTPDGGRIDITGVLQQSEETKQDELLITIKDTGIGIDPKNQELIFEKFFRVADPGLHSTGATKFMGAGPGLGLTIARGVVQGHGGRIWVESPGYDSEKLPGTTVNVLLPITPPKHAKRVLPFESTGTGTGSAPVVVLGGAVSAPGQPRRS